MVYPIQTMTLMLALVSIHGCVGRGVMSRQVERRAEGRMLATIERDAERDRASAIKVLERDRLVSRYTTAARARTEMRAGLTAGTHVTSRLRTGRPLGAERAQARYGLPVRPQAREKLLLPKGTKVRMNKALGGEPGVGEITVAGRAPKSVVRETRAVR